MRVVVATAPAAVITTAEAKQHLRVDGDEENALIDAYVAAATAHIDGPAGWLGRALGRQTLTAYFDSFECGGLCLPYPPVLTLTSVKYLDAAGVEQTIAGSIYELMGDNLVTKVDQVWPRPRWRREAVRVTYVAGYLELPKPIRAAILLMTGDLYGNRETVATGRQRVDMSTTVENLLSPYRVWR